MLQTAQIQQEEQYLKIIDKETNNSSDYIIEKSQEDLKYDLIADTLFQKVAPFYYKEKIRLSFWVRDEYKSDFIMIRGLIEFHRPKDLLFNYDLKQQSIETDINREQLDELQWFLSKVFVWLKQEKQFRLALKIALEFENRYKLERESVYEIMKKTTAVTHSGY